jgi:hypothetical protein
MAFVAGLLVGLFVGAIVGVVIVAICTAAGRADRGMAAEKRR